MSELWAGYRLDSPGQQVEGCTWHSAQREGGQGPPLRAKVADTAEARQGLALEARLVAQLSEQSPAVLPPVDWLRDGERCALILVAPSGEPLPASGAVELETALRVADAMAGLDHALALLGWSLEPRREDLRVDTQGVWLGGLERARPVLAPDAHQATRTWGRLLADLLGLSIDTEQPDLEALSRRVPPLVLDMLRAALEGHGYPRELIAELKVELDPPPNPALRARRAASFGLLEVVPGPRGPLYLACSDGADWLAIDPRVDAVVRLGADRSRWSTEPPLPLVLPPLPPVPVGALEPPPRLVVRRRPEGTVLQLADLALETEAVVLVRRREPGPLLIPADGEALATLEGPSLEEPFSDEQASPGDRYAAFPLFGDVPGPPGRARL